MSRKTDATSSPERQLQQIYKAVMDVGGHIIALADDWEVSGATDPMDRPAFGPWLRGEMGPYDGIAAASVDRVGRALRETLNTQVMLTGQGRSIVTADHVGVWDFSDPNQENEWLVKLWSSQMELRAIQKRNRDDTVRARDAGQPKQKPSYGYRFVRLVPTGKVDHVAIDDEAAEIIRDVARRILSDETGKITAATEAARLTRAGIPSPNDRRAQLYGRKPKGSPWTQWALKAILTSEAALGYLMHDKRPVIGADGRPVRIADPLWDRATHEALKEATKAKKPGSRAPKGVRLLSGLAFCGTCGARLYIAGGKAGILAYGCTGRVRGIPVSQHCKPAPTMRIPVLDQIVTDWFLARYGAGEVMKKIYDPGTGFAAQIKELQANRKRLRDDRAAGLYDAEDDAEWFRSEYARLGQEIQELKKLPERPAGMRLVPTGRTITQEWQQAPDDAARREILMEFDVRAVVHPSTARQRYAITGTELFPSAADTPAAEAADDVAAEPAG